MSSAGAELAADRTAGEGGAAAQRRAAADRRAGLVSRLFVAAGYVGIVGWLVGPQVDPDAWWHLRVADWIVAHGSLPTQDVISWWSAGAPWTSPSWLNELLLRFADGVAGPTGQSLLYVPAYAVAVWLLDRLMAVLHPGLGGWPRLAAVALVVLAISSVIEPRAGNADLVFVLVMVLAMVAWRASGSTWPLWVMPPAAIAWANLHGSGVDIFLAIAAAFVVGTWLDRPTTARAWALASRPLFVAILATVAAFALNPIGPQLYLYPWTTVTSAAQADVIAEWRAPDLGAASFLALRLLLPAVLVLGLARSQQRDAAGALLGAGLLVLGLGSARYLLVALPILFAWYLPTAGAGLRSYVDGALGRPLRSPGGPRARFLAAGLLAAVIVPLGWTSVVNALPDGQATYLASTYPDDAFRLAARCGTRTWTDYGWGGRFAYVTGAPAGPYGAADALGDERLAQAGGVERGTVDPGPLFQQLRVTAVVTHAGGPLAHWLAASSAYRIVAAGPLAVVAVPARQGCA